MASVNPITIIITDETEAIMTPEPQRQTGQVHQPARQVIKDRGWSVSAAAEALGENRSHLNSALLGRVSPCERLRRTLPRWLDMPLTELFTPELLSRTYGVRNPDPDGAPRKIRKSGLRRPRPRTDS